MEYSGSACGGTECAPGLASYVVVQYREHLSFRARWCWVLTTVQCSSFAGLLLSCLAAAAYAMLYDWAELLFFGAPCAYRAAPAALCDKLQEQRLVPCHLVARRPAHATGSRAHPFFRATGILRRRARWHGRTATAAVRPVYHGSDHTRAAPLATGYEVRRRPLTRAWPSVCSPVLTWGLSGHWALFGGALRRPGLGAGALASGRGGRWPGLWPASKLLGVLWVHPAASRSLLGHCVLLCTAGPAFWAPHRHDGEHWLLISFARAALLIRHGDHASCAQALPG